MDLFTDEQSIYNEAKKNIENVENGSSFDFNEYIKLTERYGRLLKQIRMTTRFADNLFESNLDLTDKVHYDTLTGVYSRLFLEENLDRYIKSLSRSNSILSVLFLDIDNFKNYNDTYGHDVGDVCLKSIAEVLSQCVTREEDFVARYGGEEFVIVLPHTDKNGAKITAQRVLNSVKEKNMIHEKSDVANYVTVSIGGTTIKARHTHKAMDYMKRSDEAMYKSKQNGKNRYTHLAFEEATE